MDELEKSIIHRIIGVRTSLAGERGRNKFAKMLDLSPSTYSYYEKDRIPPVPVLVKICQLCNIDLNWLLTGKNGESDKAISSEHLKIIAKTQKIIEKQPNSVNALSAFLNLLEEKASFETAVKSQNSSKNGWIPVLGRTAAGVHGSWSQSIGTDSRVVETHIEQLVQKHLNSSIVNSITADITVDSQTRGIIQALNKSQANLIQTTGNNEDDVVQFVECSEVHNLFPDSFALQVDGDSMSPRINDSDIVIVSPSLAAVEGLPAIIRISNAIGVTCKLIRMEDKSVHLIPINEKYETKVAAKNQILWSLAVICHIKLKK
ncbi:MAG: hypothetical protein A2Y10_08090 [Planctomycetes bacterium GWF2_41_51]|nr:MAG: hypothetical protein A2Y10_08090 [Planctomycetes bacterium GWF2_41_51]HBG26231.1 hypothetical protein [Phycisphaerales bacterium]